MPARTRARGSAWARSSGPPCPPRSTNISYGREGRILRCPWHEWEYDITTGESVFDPNVQIKTYPVEIRDDQVIVTIDS